MYMLAEIQPLHCMIICLALRRSAIMFEDDFIYLPTPFIEDTSLEETKLLPPSLLPHQESPSCIHDTISFVKLNSFSPTSSFDHISNCTKQVLVCYHSVYCYSASTS